MDVTCSRCQTRYEFDEALVSSRGTTVKCTSCGHQFKVRRPSGAAALDGWTVRTVDGRELRFGAMRQLQAAIHSREVSTDDVLIPNDGAEPRRLGRIEELQSFFTDPEGPEMATIRRKARRLPGDDISLVTTRVAGGSSSPGLRARDGTPLPSRTGDTLRPPASVATPLNRAPVSPRAASRRALRAAASGRSAAPPVDSSRSTGVAEDERPTIKGSRVPPDRASRSTAEAVDALQDAVNAVFDPEQAAPHRASADGEPAAAWDESPLDAVGEGARIANDDTLGEETSDVAATRARERDDAHSERPVPPGPRRIEAPSEHPDFPSLPPLTPTPSVGRPSILRRSDAYTDPRFSTFGARGRRPSLLRWVVGVVGLGLVVLIGFTLFKRHLLPAPPNSSASAAVGDARVTKLLALGEQRLAHGDVEGAKDLYVKASGISETDPRVTNGLARIEIIRADLLWLEMRLSTNDAPDRAALAQRLAQAVQRARQAVDAAAQTAGAKGLVALRIDIMRLGGKGAQARQFVAKLEGEGPDHDRLLATLDLMETSPSYETIEERLRRATSAEKQLGRARALLIYALARNGEQANAERELARLRSDNAAHPLLEPLKIYLETMDAMAAEDEADAGADESEDSAKVSATDDSVPDDFREALRRAHAAHRAGDLDRAETLFQAALDESPGNSEALTGLADVARDRGDSAGAAGRYRKMLAKNPGYLPAMVGLADIQWAHGAHSEAVSLYRQVVQSAPDSSYATHAQQRIDAATAGGAPSASSPPSPPAAPPTSTSTSSPAAPVDAHDLPAPTGGTPSPSSVDTSDLPE